VAREPRRRGRRDLVLLGSPSPPGLQERIFLFALLDLPFGAIHKLGDQRIPLVLRHLPDRATERDPFSHSRNDYVSRLHGRFALDGPDLVVRDENSTNGIVVNGRRIPPGTWVPLPCDFQLMLTANQPVIQLAGKACSGRAHPCSLTLDGTHGSWHGPSLDVGAEHAHPIDALRLTRLGNLEEHRYVQVFRLATIGSSPDSAVHLDDPTVAPNHAALVFYRGEWLVHSVEPEARTAVDGVPVGQDEYVSLAPDKVLTIGALEYRTGPATLARLARP
jgi:pSer/pThr/pTyr-binding forkhead associated (FHA) protein